MREWNQKLMDENLLYRGEVEKKNMQNFVYCRELQRALLNRAESDNIEIEQIKDIEERCNLVSEENQILTEKCNAYEIQFEAVRKAYETKINEVNQKIAQCENDKKEKEEAQNELQKAREQIEILKQKLGMISEQVM